MTSRPHARSPQPNAAGRPSARMRYRRQAGIVARAADAHLFLSGSKLNAIHELNPTGAAIWKLLETPRSETEIVDIFAAAYPERSRTELTHDVKSVLDALHEAGYVAADR